MRVLFPLLAAAVLLWARSASGGPPPALLGPDGPTWVGPFRPVGAGSSAPELVVDPATGDLWMSRLDAPGFRRQWAGWGWTVAGEAVGAASSPSSGVRYDFSDGRLTAVQSPSGALVRYRYDAAGRVVGMVEVGGASVDIAYDGRGRVSSISGPGRQKWRLTWGDRLTVQDGLGRPLTVARVGADGAGEPGIAVQDAMGRTTTTMLSKGGSAAPAVVGWRDPRGLVTRVRSTDGGIEVVDAAGRAWRLALDADRRVRALRDPMGHRWEWARDGTGRLLSATDPDGRVVAWDRDAAGRVVAVTRGGESTRLVRDREGQVVEVVDGNGSRTRLVRDRRGQVTDIVDAVGNTLAIARRADGTPTTVVERSGARWTLDFDLLSQVSRIVDPTRRELVLRRDASGAVVALEHGTFGTVSIDRGSRGAISRVVDAAGRSTGFLRDAVDRVVSVVQADGSEIKLRRDPAGDVVSIVVGEHDFEISRDPTGLPLGAGDVSWRRDGRGAVSGLSAPGIDLTLSRDAAGNLRRLHGGRWWLAVERDRAGRPVHWSGTDGDLVVARDRAGRRVSEDGVNRLQITREPRGLVAGIASGRGSWAWMRDANGRPLQLNGPDDLSLGLDRDDAGRVTLVRLPGGALLRRSWDGAVVTEQAQDADGKIVMVTRTAFDQAGRTIWGELNGGPRATWRYGPLGQLVAIETDEGAVWSWTMDVVAGPEGEVLVLDRQGRIAEARPPLGAAAWGVARAALSVFRDGLGRIDRLVGDIGIAEVAYDGIGRLASVRSATLGNWRLGYDPLGRLSWVDQEELGVQTVLWGPDAVAGNVVLAGGTDLARAWIYGPTGPAGWAEGSELAAVVTDISGSPRATIVSGQAARGVARTPQGWLDPWLGLVSLGDGVQAWAGGPVVSGRRTEDPVSGQRVDGQRPWPWVGDHPRSADRSDPLGPELWSPESPWHDPLGLLVALGVIQPIGEADGVWAVALPEDGNDRVAPWLPASLEANRPPLGLDPGRLPIDEDPVTNALLSAVLPGGAVPEPELLTNLLLAGLVDLPALPPDLSVPGAEVLR